MRSASRRLLVVPKIQLDTYGRRAFAVIGPTVWKRAGNGSLLVTHDTRDPQQS